MGQKKSVLREVSEFKASLSRELPVDKMIFFGSRARGKAHKWSDVDLVIVSKKFRGKKFRYRPLGFYRHWNSKYAVDFLCYTPEEFEKLRKSVTIVREAEREGIEI